MYKGMSKEQRDKVGLPVRRRPCPPPRSQASHPLFLLPGGNHGQREGGAVMFRGAGREVQLPGGESGRRGGGVEENEGPVDNEERGVGERA